MDQSNADHVADAHAQLERFKAQSAYLDNLQDALLNAVRAQHNQAHRESPPINQPASAAPYMALASLPLVLPPASAAPTVSEPTPPSADADASTHLLEVCTRKLAALQEQAKVTGWTAELTRRKAVLLPLMTQLLESEDMPAPVVPASIAPAQQAEQKPLVLTGTPAVATSHPYNLPSMASCPPRYLLLGFHTPSTPSTACSRQHWYHCQSPPARRWQCLLRAFVGK